MAKQLPTVTIVDPTDPNSIWIINQDDFDPTKHELWGDRPLPVPVAPVISAPAPESVQQTGDEKLLTDGPTLEEFVAAGYDPALYPPTGYAVKDSPLWQQYIAGEWPKKEPVPTEAPGADSGASGQSAPVTSAEPSQASQAPNTDAPQASTADTSGKAETEKPAEKLKVPAPAPKNGKQK